MAWVQDSGQSNGKATKDPPRVFGLSFIHQSNRQVYRICPLLSQDHSRLILLFKAVCKRIKSPTRVSVNTLAIPSYLFGFYDLFYEPWREGEREGGKEGEGTGKGECRGGMNE